MNLIKLLARSIWGRAFRSGAIFLTAALIAGLALSATLVARGAEEQLAYSLERLGADIIVIPWGTMRTEDMQGARLLSMQTEQWMPRAYMDHIAAIDGVASVTPQLYITTLTDSPYCSSPELHLVAYDPASDFAVGPWFEQPGLSLGPGEAVGGACVTVPGGETTLNILGTDLRLAGKLKPTGGDLDDALLISFETAQAIVEQTGRQKGHAMERSDLYLAPDSISAVLVRVDLEYAPHDVAITILEQVRSVLPIESTNLFQTERAQMVGLLRSALFILSVIWVLSTVFMGLIFSMAANERRREMGVLRALGGPQRFILGTLLAESAILALGGGVSGSALTITAVTLTKGALVRAAGLPFAVPTPLSLAGIALAGMALAMLSILMAAAIPAVRVSRQEVALVMRE